LVSALLEADGVVVDRDGVCMLPQTSMRVDGSSCTAVLGANGAGKTTLLRVLAGRMRASAGEVRLRGARVDERRREVRREIAALLERPTLYPDLTLRENLAVIEAAWSAEPSAESTADAQSPLVPGLGAEALEVFGISALSNRFAHELSSG